MTLETTVHCGRCKDRVEVARYWCPRCECGRTRPILGLSCGHSPPRCFTDWCPRYRQEMEPVP